MWPRVHLRSAVDVLHDESEVSPLPRSRVRRLARWIDAVPLSDVSTTFLLSQLFDRYRRVRFDWAVRTPAATFWHVPTANFDENNDPVRPSIKDG